MMYLLSILVLCLVGMTLGMIIIVGVVVQAYRSKR